MPAGLVDEIAQAALAIGEEDLVRHVGHPALGEEALEVQDVLLERDLVVRRPRPAADREEVVGRAGAGKARREAGSEIVGE